MPELAARGDGDELARFRRLVSVTIAATLVLILIGGIVRVSDSGSAAVPPAAAHGWPLCEGGVLPAASAESAIEFSHRVAAGAVAVLIAVLAWRALRRLRSHTWLVRGSIAAGVLVLLQAALGGLTVEKGLEEELVAAHLGLAMLLLGILIALRRAADPDAVAPPPEKVRGLRATTAVAGVLVLATIVAGATSPGPRRRDTNEPVVGQAHVACGTGYSADTFPACNGQFPGFGQSRLADIQLVHRSLMYLAAIAVLAMAAVALVRRAPSRAFWVAGAAVAGADRPWDRQRLGGQARRPDPRPPRPRDGSLEHRRLRWRDAPARLRARLERLRRREVTGAVPA